MTSVSGRRAARYLPVLVAVMMCFSAAVPASASPVLSYALTATSNPVGPGQAAVFTWTVTNLTNAAQSSRYCYTVPEFTSFGGDSAGTQVCSNGFSVPAGGSTPFIFDFTVLSGTSTPPDGTLISLTVTDTDDAVSVSRNVTVQSAAEAGLALSIPAGTVVPGGSFTTTLTYSNYSAGTLSGLQLSVPVPAGASFVAADGGGVLGADGLVRWAPVPLAAGITDMVHLTLQAAAIAPATAGLVVVDATLNDASNDLVAEANGALTVYASPIFSYALTTTLNPVGPGQAAVFTWTVTNLTNAAQTSAYCYVVPQFTSFGGDSAGTRVCSNNFSVPAGGSTPFIFDFTVLNGASTPPNGAIINLTVIDADDAASVSRNVTVQPAPEVGLALSIPAGTVVPGGSFTTTLTYSNYSAGTLTGLQLSVPVPAGASFVAADGGGMLGADGLVRWAPVPLAAGITDMVHLTLQAAAIAPATAGLGGGGCNPERCQQRPRDRGRRRPDGLCIAGFLLRVDHDLEPGGSRAGGGVHLDGDQSDQRNSDQRLLLRGTAIYELRRGLSGHASLLQQLFGARGRIDALHL